MAPGAWRGSVDVSTGRRGRPLGRASHYPDGVGGAVTGSSFASDVLESDIPVIVDFWAPWCKPCEAVEPHLEALAAQWGDRVRLVRVNVDEEAGLASRYGVLSLPTVILFAGGRPLATVYGAQPRTRFERDFAPHL